MSLFIVPHFDPGFRPGTQIVNLQTGGPSGAAAGFPIINQAAVPRTGPNGNATSMNGAGGYISGIGAYHWPGPDGYVPPGVQPYGNQYAFANQTMFIPGMIKNPMAAS
jgi:hypothetical protein